MRNGPDYRYGRALLAAAARFNRKNGWVMSSHVAMSMLMALFPFLLFVVALAGALTTEVETEALVDLVLGSWPEGIAAPIAREVRTVLSSGGTRLLTVGAVLALYFASNGIDALRAAMTRAYRGHDPRPWWRQRLLCLAFVLGWSATLVVAAVAGIAVPLYLSFVQEAAPDLYGTVFGNDLMRRGLTLLVLLALVTACHLWLPGARREPAHIWPGILLTVMLWTAAGVGFAWYLERFASYSATYAGLAGVMTALIFLYLMSAILIFGAEFNGALGNVDRSRRAG